MEQVSGRYVICVYRPKPGAEAALAKALERHLDVLDRGGFLRSRDRLLLQSEQDGSILELFAWKSEEAAGQAHANPSVQQIWGELAEAAEMLSLKDLAEAGESFPHFNSLVLGRSGS